MNNRVKETKFIVLKNLLNIFCITLILLVNTGFSQQDSINQLNSENKKVGHWIYTNEQKNLPGYKSDQKVEEGNYVNGKKEGEWIFYFNNGNIKHILHYKNNIPDGKAIFYYKNGNKREEGIWKNNRWVGEYKLYYRNGNLKNHFNYNQQGLKEGEQNFYYENGNVMLTGTWSKGSETEKIYEYNEDGSPNTSRYEAGPALTPTPVSKPAKTIENKPDTTEQKTIVKKQSKPKKATPFDGNGYHEFKDKYGNNSKVGEFENGLLVDGKIFKYDSKGKLELTKIVKNGSIVKVIRVGQE